LFSTLTIDSVGDPVPAENFWQGVTASLAEYPIHGTLHADCTGGQLVSGGPGTVTLDASF